MVKECKMELKEGLYIDNTYYDKGTHEGLKLNLTEIQQVIYSGYGNKVFQKNGSDPDTYTELTKHNFDKEIVPMKDLGESTPVETLSKEEGKAGAAGGEEDPKVTESQSEETEDDAGVSAASFRSANTFNKKKTK